MIKLVWVLAGTSSYYLDRLAIRLRRAGRWTEERTRVEKTGRLVQTPVRPDLEEHPPNVWLLRYPGHIAHSLWRSQELSLLRKYATALPEPRLDFGCGDGSFAAALFGHVAYGVDVDEEALRIAAEFGVYDHMLLMNGEAIPLPDGTAGSVFANSVLEHTSAVEPIVAELHRLIAPGGRLAITVPTTGFSRHLTKYFGVGESEFLNHRFDHRQMHSPQWWRTCVAAAGFAIEIELQYQPDWFTFTYRVLTTGTMAFLLRRGLADNPRARATMAALVRRSVAGTADGANLFVLARRL